MAVVLSHDFTGIGTGTVGGVTLNNALGGSASKSFVTLAPMLTGNGADAVNSGGSTTAQAIVDVSGLTARKYRIKFTPGATPTLNIFALANANVIGTITCTGVALLTNHTSLQIRTLAAGAQNTRATTTTTAPGTTFYLELEVDATELIFTGRILNADFSIRDSVTWNATAFPGAVSNGGDNVSFGHYFSSASSVLDDFTVDDGTTVDTTPPTVTSVSGTDTGSTSATVSASSTEAGPAWCVLTPTSTQPSQAQVEAGQDHTGSTTGVFLDTATLAIGANPAAFAFTGLTPGATYWPHVVAKDTATPTANVSAVESGPSFTMPSPDVTAPAWPPGTTLDIVSKTDTTVTLEASDDATDASGVDGYAWSSDGGATFPFTSLTKTFTFTALTPNTSYDFECVPYDPTPTEGLPISVTTSTYRVGALGQDILDDTGPVGDNPAGLLYDRVEAGEENDWFWLEVTEEPATGVLEVFANGTYTFTGPDATVAMVQFGKNDSAVGSPVPVYLYTQEIVTPPPDPTPSNATKRTPNGMIGFWNR